MRILTLLAFLSATPAVADFLPAVEDGVTEIDDLDVDGSQLDADPELIFFLEPIDITLSDGTTTMTWPHPLMSVNLGDTIFKGDGSQVTVVAIDDPNNYGSGDDTASNSGQEDSDDSDTSLSQGLRGFFDWTRDLIGNEDPGEVLNEAPVGSIGIRG